MAAGPDEVMPIPVDANAGVSESFITAVERNVVIYLRLIFIDVSFHASECGFFLDREDEHQIAFRLNFRFIQGANRRQQRLDVAGVVANAGCVDSAVTDRGFDLQARLKDRVHVRIKDNQRPTAGSSTNCDQVAGGIVVNIVEMILSQQTLNVFRALLFLPRWRVDFSNRDPFMQNAFVIAIDVIVRGLDDRTIGDCLKISDVLGNSLDLRERAGGKNY